MDTFNTTTRRHLILFLRWAAFAVFAGRAWQHWFWDIPIRTLLWDQALMEPVIHALTSMSWEQYVSSSHIDKGIQYTQYSLGYFYGALAVFALLIKKAHRRRAFLFPAGSVLLFLLSLLFFKDNYYRIGQLMEYTAQWSAPLFLYLLLFRDISKERILFWMKMAIAFTFVGHGLYAIGLYPVPGEFVQMFTMILGVDDPTAILLLKIAGILDFVIAIGIFFPRVALPLLAYATFWGLVTALARTLGHFYPDAISITLKQWLFETVVRLPHALLPLGVFWVEKWNFKKNRPND